MDAWFGGYLEGKETFEDIIAACEGDRSLYLDLPYNNGLVRIQPPLISVTLWQSGVVAHAAAKCHPTDEFDFALGFTLAKSRAYQRLGKKVERKMMRLVNRADKAK